MTSLSRWLAVVLVIAGCGAKPGPSSGPATTTSASEPDGDGPFTKLELEAVRARFEGTHEIFNDTLTGKGMFLTVKGDTARYARIDHAGVEHVDEGRIRITSPCSYELVLQTRTLQRRFAWDGDSLYEGTGGAGVQTDGDEAQKRSIIACIGPRVFVLRPMPTETCIEWMRDKGVWKSRAVTCSVKDKSGPAGPTKTFTAEKLELEIHGNVLYGDNVSLARKVPD